MRHILTLILILLSMPAFSQTVTGEIKKQAEFERNRVFDADTNTPIKGATVKVPSKHYKTVTNSDGVFELKTEILSPTILSVSKSGYKPFSLTIDENGVNNPILAGISKSSPYDTVIDTDMIHIGDNSFSKNSANASEFCLRSCGAFYSKDFKIDKFSTTETLFLVLGSVIGIDTSQAQKLGQSHVLTAFAGPPEIYFNNNKLADIKINGDNQKIPIPYSLINFNGTNNITIKAGRNLCKKTAVDYDDIEFTNILLELK